MIIHSSFLSSSWYHHVLVVAALVVLCLASSALLVLSLRTSWLTSHPKPENLKLQNPCPKPPSLELLENHRAWIVSPKTVRNP